jgi:hypothetical protein
MVVVQDLLVEKQFVLVGNRVAIFFHTDLGRSLGEFALLITNTGPDEICAKEALTSVSLPPYLESCGS